MDMLMMGGAALLGLLGALLMGLFFWMRFTAEMFDARITGFQEEKSKGCALPIVKEDGGEEGEAQEVRTLHLKTIEQIGYLLTPPGEGALIRVALMKNGRAGVFGYLKLAVGALLILLALALLGMGLDKSFFTGQVMFTLIFLGISVGGWLVLKLIPRSY